MRSMHANLILVYTLYSSHLSHPSDLAFETLLSIETSFIRKGYFRERGAIVFDAGRYHELGYR